jgi:hypothetical protein
MAELLAVPSIRQQEQTFPEVVARFSVFEPVNRVWFAWESEPVRDWGLSERPLAIDGDNTVTVAVRVPVLRFIGSSEPVILKLILRPDLFGGEIWTGFFSPELDGRGGMVLKELREADDHPVAELGALDDA